MKEYNFDEAKKRWHEICEDSRYKMPIYHKDWYWNAVCDSEDEWRVIVYETKDLVAAFPFCYRKIHGMLRIENAWQVARGGIWIHFNTDNLHPEKRNHLYQEVTDYMIDNLPAFDYFNVIFLPEYRDCQPMYWHGFEVGARCNHFIRNRTADEAKRMATKNRRKRINGFSKDYEIKINEISVDDYWEFFEKSYTQRDRKISYEKDKFKNLITALQTRNQVQIRGAYKDNQLFAGIILPEDDESLYMQFGTQIPGHGDSQSGLTYSAILYCMEHNKKFDFEGSMIKGVAEYNLSFGPETELCYIFHKESKKYRTLNAIRQLLKK